MEETHVQALEVHILFFIQEKNKAAFRRQELVQVPDLLHIYCKGQINGGKKKY